MIDLNLQLEEINLKNADFQISKVFKTYYKDYLVSIVQTSYLETTGGKDFF